MSSGSSMPVTITTGRRSPAAASSSAASRPSDDRHLDVEEVEVGWIPSGERNRFAAVSGWAERLVAEPAQAFGQRRRDNRVVVLDDEDPHADPTGKTTSAWVRARVPLDRTKRPSSPSPPAS
jgi:hypothetical protein